MFLVHKKGFVAGKKMVDGLVPYDFFCEDDPAINLFVFTGNGLADTSVQDQTLWGFTQLDRFEALAKTLDANRPADSTWFQSVSVLTGPAQNGTRTVRFQQVTKVTKHDVVEAKHKARAAYAIHTLDGDTYYTRPLADAASHQTIIYVCD